MLKKSKVGKFVISISLVLGLLIPSMSFADGELGETGKTEEKSFEIGRAFEKFDRKRPEGRFKRPDMEREGKLLEVVEKYSPETLKDWNNAIETRKELHDELIDMKEELKGSKERRKEFIEERKRDMKESYKKANFEEFNKLKEKVNNGEITKEEAWEQLKEIKENHIELAEEKKEELKEKRELWRENLKEKTEQIKAHREEMRTLRSELIEAVEADDSEKVKSILSELLVEFENTNDKLAEKIENFKEKQIEIITNEEI